MTRKQVGKQARFLIDEHGLNWLEEKNAEKFTLDDAIDKAYLDVAEETKCFHSIGYTKASVASTSVYSFSDFGTYTTWAVATAKVVGDIVVPTTANGHKYICTDAGTTHTATEPTWGTAKNSTLTDGVVNSITWKEYGSDATAGSRIFEPKVVAYNSIALQCVNESYLAAWNKNWQFTTSGTPTYWLMHGIDKFKLYPTPSGTSNIYIEGYEYPDLGAYDDDDDESLLGANHDDVIALGAAIFATIADPNDMNTKRQSILYPMYQSGIAAIKARAFAANKQDTIFSRFRGEVVNRRWYIDDSALL